MIRREELRRLRNLKGLSQRQLADLAGCSQQAIAAMEQGKQEQSGYIFKVAKALDAPLSDLETEVLPINGLLYTVAEKLQQIDPRTAERFLRRIIESLSDFQSTTDMQVAKIARFPARLEPQSKRRPSRK